MRINFTILNAATGKHLDDALVTLTVGPIAVSDPSKDPEPPQTLAPLSGDTVLIQYEAAPAGRFIADIDFSHYPSLKAPGNYIKCRIEKEGFAPHEVQFSIGDSGGLIESTFRLDPLPKKIRINWKRVLLWSAVILGSLLLLGLIAWGVKHFFFGPPPPQAAIMEFTANGQTKKLAISPEQKVLLKWDTLHAVDVTLNGQPVDHSDTKKLKPAEDIEYELRVHSQEGPPKKKKIEIEIVPLPEIVQFSAAPATIRQWGSSVISWETKNAHKLYIQAISDDNAHVGEARPIPSDPALGGAGTPAGGKGRPIRNLPPKGQSMEGDQQTPGIQQDLNGAVEVIPLTSTTYLLTAENSIGARVTRRLDLTVLVPPEIRTFTATTLKIRKGQSTLLRWDTSEAGEVTLNGDRVPPFFAQQVKPDITTTYTLTATNPIGKRLKQITVEIVKDPDPPKEPAKPLINQFLTEPDEIAYGQASRLSWVTQNADAVYLDGVRVESVGFKFVAPTKNSAYKLKVVNPKGAYDWSRTVLVSPRYKVILYELENYRGAFEEISADSPYLGELDNDVSSIRIIGNCSVRVFSDDDFKATTQDFDKSIPRLRGTWIGNDTISSIRIIDKNRLTLPQAPSSEKR